MKTSMGFGSLFFSRASMLAASLALLLGDMAQSARGVTLTTLHSFNISDGFYPIAGLVRGSDGNFYGTTQQGGIYCSNTNDVDYGTVFKITPGGVLTTLHSFDDWNVRDGCVVWAGLVQGSDGNFYGTTSGGGTPPSPLIDGGPRGVVFKITPSGAFSQLHCFGFGEIHGENPMAGLVLGQDGCFYGTTSQGGAGHGTVFRITTSGLLTILHVFNGTDGGDPEAGLVQGSDGNFYGTTVQGGAYNVGTVFKITPGGTLTVLHSFTGGSDGGWPWAGLVQGRDGNFYGTTYYGGANDDGTVFKITSSGTLTTLHSFALNDGSSPWAGLVQGSDDNFYGTTFGGGDGHGTIFRITSGGVLTTLHKFNGTDGNCPMAGLIQGSDGCFYGTTAYGGTYGWGAVFKLDVGLPATGGNTDAASLAAAVNLPGSQWTTGGGAAWYRQTTTTRDGAAAARSGTVSHGQETWFQTTTNGPGSLLFWWKASSEPNDYLEFYAYTDTETQAVARISGNANWQQFAAFLSKTNTYTLKWRYVKNGSISGGSDAGWVDEVTWIPCPYAKNVPQLFFQNSSGLLASWILNSTGGFEFARILANTGTWALKAAGDIDGDGVSDLLFQTPANDTGGWFMNADGSYRDARFWWNTAGWVIKACADFEGVGRAQLFFQTTSGLVAYWRLDTNGVFQSAVVLGNMGSWQLRGGGDIDGDGKAELFWQNAAGSVAVWYHNPDGSIRGVIPFNTSVWALRGVTDVDKDGVSDLLWQTPDLRTGGWFMNADGTFRDARFWWPTIGWQLKAAGR